MNDAAKQSTIWLAVISTILMVTAGMWIAQPTVSKGMAQPAVPKLMAVRSTPQVYFSPHGGCTKAIVDILHTAQHNVRVQAYSFTSEPILTALNDAQARKLDVQVILDRGQTSKRSAAHRLTCPYFYDYMHAIAHNKIIIVDETIVLTGSFNFTAAAEEHNAENLLILHDPALAQQYLKNWDLHRAHSQVPIAAHD